LKPAPVFLQFLSTQEDQIVMIGLLQNQGKLIMFSVRIVLVLQIKQHIQKLPVNIMVHLLKLSVKSQPLFSKNILLLIMARLLLLEIQKMPQITAVDHQMLDP
jgi:hypothetical protein